MDVPEPDSFEDDGPPDSKQQLQLLRFSTYGVGSECQNRPCIAIPGWQKAEKDDDLKITVAMETVKAQRTMGLPERKKSEMG